MGYTVGEVAQWSGVTVRTLHHYEHIALLSPAARSSSGYRVYDDGDLERLQPVLPDIKKNFDDVAALTQQFV
jgi:DNA-binding transcriptional MerR regulator